MTRQLSGNNRGGWRLETASGALCDVGVVVRGAVVTIWTRHSVLCFTKAKP